MQKLIVVPLFGIALMACSGRGQSFEEAMRISCDAPNHTTAEQAPYRAQALAAWVEEHVTNEEARELWESLASLSPAEKAAKFREAAERVGIEDCLMVKVWQP